MQPVCFYTPSCSCHALGDSSACSCNATTHPQLSPAPLLMASPMPPSSSQGIARLEGRFLFRCLVFYVQLILLIGYLMTTLHVLAQMKTKMDEQATLINGLQQEARSLTRKLSMQVPATGTEPLLSFPLPLESEEGWLELESVRKKSPWYGLINAYNRLIYIYIYISLAEAALHVLRCRFSECCPS